MRFNMQELDFLERMVKHYPQFKDMMKSKLQDEVNTYIHTGGELQQGRCQMLTEIVEHLETNNKLAKRTVAQPNLNSTP